MNGEGAMSEQWEKAIETELDFLYHSPEYEAELLDRLRENELNIQYPVTHFDSEQGRIYRSCPGTEEQAIRRIEIREAIEAIMVHMNKRIKRMSNAIHQLSEEEQDLISRVYIERDTPEIYMARSLGFRTIREFRKAKQQALLKLLKIFEKERDERDKEFKEFQKVRRKEIVRNFLGLAQ
jgi:hypothetical protein